MVVCEYRGERPVSHRSEYVSVLGTRRKLATVRSDVFPIKEPNMLWSLTKLVIASAMLTYLLITFNI